MNLTVKERLDRKAKRLAREGQVYVKTTKDIEFMNIQDLSLDVNGKIITIGELLVDLENKFQELEDQKQVYADKLAEVDKNFGEILEKGIADYIKMMLAL